MVEEESPLACPFVVGIFKTPVLSEILLEGTLIRREIRTLGVLASKGEETVTSKYNTESRSKSFLYARQNKSLEIVAISHFKQFIGIS